MSNMRCVKKEATQKLSEEDKFLMNVNDGIKISCEMKHMPEIAKQSIVIEIEENDDKQNEELF